jgi:hypothetical protein
VFTSVLLAAMGCEEPNSLKGSITDSHDLAFDTVRLRLFTDQQAYELRYEKALEGGAQDIVAKLVFDVPEGGIVLDKAIDLLPLGGQVERITAKNDPFPGVERADVTFTAGGVDDGLRLLDRIGLLNREGIPDMADGGPGLQVGSEGPPPSQIVGESGLENNVNITTYTTHIRQNVVEPWQVMAIG